VNNLKVRRFLYEDGDPLSPARGIILGVILGAAVWTVGLVAAWWIVS